MKPTHLVLALALAAAPVGGTPAFAQSDGRNLEIRVCNESGRDAAISIAYKEHGRSDWIVRGWFVAYNGQCITVANTYNLVFYMYGETHNDGDRYWGGSHDLCIQYPGPFAYYNSGNGGTCPDYQETKPFRTLEADRYGTYTWTLDP